MDALLVLRGASIEDWVATFVAHELSVDDGKHAQGLQPRTEQFRGMLPSRCGPIIDESFSEVQADRGEAGQVRRDFDRRICIGRCGFEEVLGATC